MNRLPLLALGCAFALPLLPVPAVGGEKDLAWRKTLDAYLDQRGLPPAEAQAATEKLARQLADAGLTPADVERLLRQGRASYPPAQERGRLLFLGPLECEHVDYTTEYFLYVPRSYDPAKATPLLLVGHGGNGAMSRAYAKAATEAGVRLWLPVAEKEGLILAAP